MVARAAIEIVGINDSEGAVDSVFGAEDGMAGSPGFCAFWGDGEMGGEEGVEFLVYALAGDMGSDSFEEGVLEVGFDVFSYDEYDIREAGFDGVVEGVV